MTRGQRFEGVLLRCFILKDPTVSAGIRFGFVVPSRKFNAVMRNRLKRLMRESVAGQWPAWVGTLVRAGKGLDVVVFYKGSGTRLSRRVQLRDVDLDLERIRSNAAAVL